MNTIITLKKLIELIAKTAEADTAEAEAFVKAFTTQIRDELSSHGSVSVKGIGEFSVADGDKIKFIPAKEFATAVNEPFEMFEPEELDEQFTDAEFASPVSPRPPQSAQTAPNETIAAAEPQPAPQTEKVEKLPTEVETPEQPAEAKTEHMQPAPATEESETAEQSQTPEPQAKPTLIIRPWEEDEKAEENDEYDEYASRQHSREDNGGFPWFWTLIGMLLGLILGICIGFFAHDPIEEALEPSLAEDAELADDYGYDDISFTEPEDSLSSIAEEPAAEAAPAEEKNEEATQPAPKAEETQAAAATPAAPAQKPQQESEAEVYETIRSGTNLAKLAKKHYGENVYWVYIYLENQKAIPNPNRVPEGVKVKIPPLSKYATQSTDAERRAAAQKKVSEVLAKYPH